MQAGAGLAHEFHSTLLGPTPTFATAGTECVCKIELRDTADRAADGPSLVAAVRLMDAAELVPSRCAPHVDGEFYVLFTPRTAAAIEVSATLGGRHIVGSPRVLDVAAGPVSAGSCVLRPWFGGEALSGGLLCAGRSERLRLVTADGGGNAVRTGGFFFSISEHADGERRRPVSIGRYLKTRLTETFPMPPFDSIHPSAFAVVPRKVAENRTTR